MSKYTFRERDEIEELSFYDPLIQDLLSGRGIRTLKEAEEFLNPSYENHLNDPFLISGMDVAVDRILKAIKNEEEIVIWSDYDHDGIPGGVILHDFFKQIGYKKFRNYIPNRHTEGYGVNVEGVRNLARDGVTLMITVDVGITDCEAIEVANDLQVDVVVTDHHLPGEKLPNAFVILNSKQDHCEYPDKMLCGAGVAWKLVLALIARGNFREIPTGFEKWLLDLVGISTVADMVPLRKENRVLAHYGLKVLRKTRRPGLLKLFRKTGIKQAYINEDDIGFTIAPRINATSRMDSPYLAFELLSSKDDGRVETIVSEIEKLNDVRKGTVAGMVKEIKHKLTEREYIPEVIVLGNPHWKPALLGLAAMSVVEDHGRPVFIWGREESGVLKGSCRSPGSVNLVSLMQRVREGVLIGFGGHAFSGGFSVSNEEVHFLEEHLNEAYKNVSKDDVAEQIIIDKELTFDDVNSKVFENISKLAPFGEGNPKPVFLFRGVKPEKVRSFGKSSDHLELTFRKSNGDFVRAIEFFSNRKLNEGEKIDLIANMERSTFGRYPELRLRIIDVL